jgi:hypothetical protein
MAKKEELNPKIKKQAQEIIEEVKALDNYAKTNLKKDPINSALSYIQASRFLYQLGSLNPGYNKKAEEYEKSAEKIAIKLSDKGNHTEATSIMAALDKEKGEAYGDALYKKGKYEAAGLSYALAGNKNKLKNVVADALRQDRYAEAHSILTSLLKLEQQKAAKNYEKKKEKEEQSEAA